MDCNNKILTKSLRTCKTTFNNLYWGFLQSHQQELWQELILRYKNKHDSVLHIVAFLYKIYMYKLKISHKVKTIKSPEPAKPVELTKPVEPVKSVEPTKLVKKEKFLGAIRHTPLSNYKEWKKSEMGFKTSDKVETKLFSEWKKKDNFNPKLYNKDVPWFNYISENML